MQSLCFYKIYAFFYFCRFKFDEMKLATASREGQGVSREVRKLDKRATYIEGDVRDVFALMGKEDAGGIFSSAMTRG